MYPLFREGSCSWSCDAFIMLAMLIVFVILVMIVTLLVLLMLRADRMKIRISTGHRASDQSLHQGKSTRFITDWKPLCLI